MKSTLTTLLFCLFFVFVAAATPPQKPAKVNWKKVKVLVYTKNGKGYVHENVPYAAKSIQQLGQQHGFQVEVSDDPGLFTEENLKKYTLLIFPSTNNDVFDTDAQRLAFRRYIEAGGGFVGLHSVTGTERNWTWFKRMMGGTFAWHAKFQPFKIKKLDADHPSMQGVSDLWERADECYFLKEMYPGPQVLMAHQMNSINPNEAEKVKNAAGTYADYYPAVWFHEYDGGLVWITTLGHDKKDYQDPAYLHHVLQGIRFVASQTKKLDYSKAYATSRDTPLP
ncbi:MAG: ThuA domain-containing protein [Adhaeribacter sp.]